MDDHATLEKLMVELEMATIDAQTWPSQSRPNARLRAARQSLRDYLSERTLTEEEGHCLLCGRREVENMVFVRDARSRAFVCMICRDEQVSGRSYTPPKERPDV